MADPLAPSHALEMRTLTIVYLGKARETTRSLKERIAPDAIDRARAWADENGLDLVRHEPTLVGGTQGDLARVSATFITPHERKDLGT